MSAMTPKKQGMTMIIAGIVVVVLGSIILFAGKSDQPSQPTVTESTTMTTVILKTNEGDITLELFDNLAPKTVENFVTLAKDDFYDGVRFHRVIQGFMIQSGDPLSKELEMQAMWGTGGPGYQFEDEIHAENRNNVGTISMANAGPDTNGSQFFINVADNNFLDPKHTVFGRVTEGYDIVEMISRTPTEGPDRPIDEIIIEDVVVQ